uniref:Uncharacterized protein n=1 Tax=Glossina pallidipes TaxID=7398 RepID=A0A1B0AE78_GLOPL
MNSGFMEHLPPSLPLGLCDKIKLLHFLPQISDINYYYFHVEYFDPYRPGLYDADDAHLLEKLGTNSFYKNALFPIQNLPSCQHKAFKSKSKEANTIQSMFHN